MKKMPFALPIALLMCLNTGAFAYDTDMAKSYEALFAPATEAKVGKELHLMKPEVFAEKLSKNKDIVTVDVRTPGESGLFTLALPNSLTISIDQLFKPENLQQIPTDKPVVVVCKSGARAMAAGTALRHVGFNNAYILKGGFQDLAAYYGAKEAYPQPETTDK